MCSLPADIPLQFKKFRVEMALKSLGLRHVADTVVGSETLRGVSGGAPCLHWFSMDSFMAERLLSQVSAAV